MVIPSSPLYVGGVLIGGIAIVVPGKAKFPVGGIVIGGNADVIPGKALKYIGGVILGGDAKIVPGHPYITHGGVLLGGVAEVVPGKIGAYTGGVILGGHGSYSAPIAGQVLSVDCDVFVNQLRLTCDNVLGLTNGDIVLVSGCTNTPAANGTWTVQFLAPFPFNSFEEHGNPCGSYVYGPEPAATWKKL
jgi:hypothetical protein